MGRELASQSVFTAPREKLVLEEVQNHCPLTNKPKAHTDSLCHKRDSTHPPRKNEQRENKPAHSYKNKQKRKRGLTKQMLE